MENSYAPWKCLAYQAGEGQCVGEVIAVVSGKGGTGKTTVCAGVAGALAQEGKTVLCIDCDAGLRNLDITLGISDMDALSFSDVLSGNYGLNQSLQHPAFENLRFLTAPVNWQWSESAEKAFEKMLIKARKKFQFILLDVPSGIGEGFRRAAQWADQTLLVMTADPAAIRNAARAAEELEKIGKSNVRLVINRVDHKLFAKMKLTVDDIMDETGVSLLGLVPEDPVVPLAAAGKISFLLKTKKGVTAACCRLAKRLQGVQEPIGI